MQFDERRYTWKDNPPALHAQFGEGRAWLWPAVDESLYGDITTVLDMVEHVLPLVPESRRQACVQAGGAVGVWPSFLAKYFNHVYTFEPNPESFICLSHNTAPYLNVHKYEAALGFERELIHVAYPEHVSRTPGKENIGGFRVFKGGSVPVLRIDDLGLTDCSLLMLDVEGYEWEALKGATETIRRCAPVIVLEDKLGCTKHFGYKPGDISRWLASNFAYREHHRWHGGRDIALTPKREV